MVAAACDRISSTCSEPVLDHQLEGAGEQEVADQDAEALLPNTALALARPRRSCAFVHHVVVQQRGGVDELDAGGEVHVPHAPPA